MSLTLRSQDAAEERKKLEVNGLEVESGLGPSLLIQVSAPLTTWLR